MQGADGRVPPGYRFVRDLGAGATGTVCLARHEALARDVAIKRVVLTRGGDTEDRFRREARALARLDDPTIVRLYDVVAVDRLLYLVEEYVDGPDFRIELGAEQPDRALRLRVLADIAGALTHLAAREVVHRDVKPANVLVTRDGRGKLADLGIARLLDDRTAFRTADGEAIGTPAYMAPEQIVAGTVDARTDTYAFAVLAYEATTGRLPFDARSIREQFAAHLDARPRDPNTLVAGYPSSAARALLAALHKDPAQRPPIAELAVALAAIPIDAWPLPHRGAGVPALVETDGDGTMTATRAAPSRDTRSRDDAHATRFDGDPTAPALEPAAFQPAAGRQREQHPHRRRRRGAMAILATVVLLAVVVAVAVTLDRHRATSSDFALRGVDVAVVGNDHATCAGPTFTFVAVMRTNGEAGTIRARWVGPDDQAHAPITIPVARGAREARPEFRFRVGGQGRLEGRARIDVRAPAQLSAASKPVVYSCP